MSKSKFNASATVVGKVQKKEIKEDIGNGLGKIILKSNENRVFYNVWNRKNNTNIVDNFMKDVVEDEQYFLMGELTENEYEGNINRNIRAFINKDGEVVNFSDSENSDEKAVASISGDVRNKQLKYTDNIPGVQKKDEHIPLLKFKVLIFNTYNSDNKDEPLSRNEVLMEELKRNKEYAEENPDKVNYDIDELKDLFDSLNADDSYTTILDVYDLMKEMPIKIYNVDELNLTAIGDLADKMAEEVEEGMNITCACYIKNQFKSRDYDEFGTPIEDDSQSSSETINRIEVAKFDGGYTDKKNIYGINEDMLGQEDTTGKSKEW